MSFLIGTLIGAALGLAIDREAWLAGAIIGGVIGWLVGRKRGVDKDERSHSIGVYRREGDRHRRPVGVRHDRRPSGPDRVEFGGKR